MYAYTHYVTESLMLVCYLLSCMKSVTFSNVNVFHLLSVTLGGAGQV